MKLYKAFRKFYSDTQNGFQEIDQSVLQSASHYKQQNEMQQLQQKLMNLRLANKEQKVISFSSGKNQELKGCSESSTEAPIQQSKQESYCQEYSKHDQVINSLQDDDGGPNSIAKKIIQQNKSPYKRGEGKKQSNSAASSAGAASTNTSSAGGGGAVKEIDTDDKAMGLSDFKYDLVFDDDQNQEGEEEEDDDDNDEQEGDDNQE